MCTRELKREERRGAEKRIQNIKNKSENGSRLYVHIQNTRIAEMNRIQKSRKICKSIEKKGKRISMNMSASTHKE